MAGDAGEALRMEPPCFGPRQTVLAGAWEPVGGWGASLVWKWEGDLGAAAFVFHSFIIFINSFLFFKSFFIFQLYLTYNIVLVSGVQAGDQPLCNLLNDHPDKSWTRLTLCNY